jgi:hypothetical protein
MSDLQYWEQIHAHLNYQYHKLDYTMSCNQGPYAASIRSKSVEGTSSDVPKRSSPALFADHEVQQAENQSFKIFLNPKTSYGPYSLGKSLSSTVDTSVTTSSIYRKLYQRFLARKILRHKPTILNRRTSLSRRQTSVNDNETENEVWESETCGEKAQRTLRFLGIEMSHTPITWSQRQFIEANPLGKHRCYRPSFLRWSWTIVEDGEIEVFPNGEE